MSERQKLTSAIHYVQELHMDKEGPWIETICQQQFDIFSDNAQEGTVTRKVENVTCESCLQQLGWDKETKSIVSELKSLVHWDVSVSFVDKPNQHDKYRYELIACSNSTNISAGKLKSTNINEVDCPKCIKKMKKMLKEMAILDKNSNRWKVIKTG